MHDVGAGRADVGGGAGSSPSPARSWTSIETGKSWSVPIDSGVWPWIMTPLLAQAQSGPPRHLVADDAVLDAEDVVRERLVVEEVAEAVVEGAVVVVVGDAEDAVFDAEGVGVVVAGVVAGDFGRPAGEVAAVEELDPLAGVGRRSRRRLDRQPPASAEERRIGGKTSER